MAKNGYIQTIRGQNRVPSVSQNNGAEDAVILQNSKT